MKKGKGIWLLLAAVLLLYLGNLYFEPFSPSDDTLPPQTEETADAAQDAALAEDGSYDSRDEVALYIHLYGCLPSNYISKQEAQSLGWDGGSVEQVAPGTCIGGGRFGNYEGLLPEGDYAECDIDTLGASSRGTKRLVYSSDGRIYYTDDHYESFTQLYG